MIIAQAPVRVSLAGGGTDVAEYYERFGGMVVSTAISRYCYVLLQNRTEDGFGISSASDAAWATWHPGIRPSLEPPLALPQTVLAYFMEHGILRESMDLFLSSEVPMGTGLGASSAMAVALITALNAATKNTMNAQQVAKLACHFEIDRLAMPIGKQDQYASAYGGLNTISFSQDNIQVTPLQLSTEVLSKIQQRLMLFATGLTHNSSKILAAQQKNMQKDESTLEKLGRMKSIAFSMQDALLHEEVDEVGTLLDQAWQDKKSLSADVTTSRIDHWYDLARQAGAIGGKITGAGGGGFLLLYCLPSHQRTVRQAMSQSGLREMTFKIAASGPRAWIC